MLDKLESKIIVIQVNKKTYDNVFVVINQQVTIRF